MSSSSPTNNNSSLSRLIPNQLNKSTVWKSSDNEHALQTGWCFWYDKKEPYNKVDPITYRSKLIKLGSFDTIENFWRLYCHIKRPSLLDLNVNLYLFRDGNHCPLWEAYPRGGCWILKIKKKADVGASVLGNMWQDIVLAAIGEAFEEPDVVGISVCIRKNEDMLSVWNSDSRNTDIKFNIGEKMKQFLDLEPETVLEYKHHSESMADLSTFRNAKQYVQIAESTPTKSTDDK